MKYFYIILLFLISNKANCQILLNNLPKEKEVVITNNNIFLVGETLKYKLLVLNEENKTPSLINKIGYVYLVNFKKEILVRQKVFLKDGMSNGDFLIASNLATGHYKLVFTTNQNLNSSVIISGVKDIYIINPYQSLPKEQKNKKTIVIEKNKKYKDYNLFAKVNQRQKIEFKIDTLNLEEGNYIIHVHKLENLKILNEEIDYSYKNSDYKFHIPEVRGELISGKLVDLENKSLKNKGISLSITNNPDLFKNVITDSLGNFYFTILNNYKKGKLIINTTDINLINQCNVILDKKNIDFKNQFIFNNIKIDEKLFNWLQQKSTEIQIENAYFKYKEDHTFNIQNKMKFYGSYTKSYLLDNYTRFSTVKETFTEIIDLAYVRRKQGKHLFYINFGNENFKNEKLKPLLIIDGIQILDHDILYNYHSKKIKKINILNKVFFYGPFSYNGIIEIETFEKNYSPKKNEVLFITEFESPVKQKEYFQPNYEKNLSKYKRIPDYRTELYWNSNIDNKIKKISFYTSDVIGLFEIDIEGYTKNGHFINKKYYFKVK